MDVRIARPIDANRIVLSKGDGAYVSMMQGEKGVLVEKLRKIASENGRKVPDFTTYPCRLGWPADQPVHHLLKHLSLSLGRSLFPENFPEPYEIRFFKMRGKRGTAAYHSYVPDDNGVAYRLKEAMRRFYVSRNDKERYGIIEEAAKEEHAFNPNLASELEKLGSAGIIIDEPEWNYRISEGKTVFLDVAGLDIPKSFSWVKHLDDPVASSLLSLIGAIQLRSVSATELRQHPKRSPDAKPFRSFYGERIEAIHGVVLGLALSRLWEDAPPYSLEDCGLGFEHWRSVLSSVGAPINGTGISQKLGSTLERILENRF